MLIRPPYPSTFTLLFNLSLVNKGILQASNVKKIQKAKKNFGQKKLQALLNKTFSGLLSDFLANYFL